MTEKEMRDIVVRLVRKSLRQVVMPAALGVGLSFAGCGSNAVPTYGAPVAETGAHETGLPAPRYGAPFTDAGLPALKYSAPFADAGTPTGKYMAPFADAGEPTVKYMAPFADAGEPTVKYMAPFADAGEPTVKYMAPFADAGPRPREDK
jgi:hypothetical protein